MQPFTKTTFNLFENPPTTIFIRVGTSCKDWDPKMVGPIILLSVKGACRTLGPGFSEFYKITDYDAKIRFKIGFGKVGQNYTFLCTS